MRIFEAIVLGLLQGLTEFLPISSSAHLLVVPSVLGWDDPGAAFSAIVQLGTVAAVLWYFRHDIVQVAAGWGRGLADPAARDTHFYRMGWVVVVGTIPISVFGLAFQSQIEGAARSVTLAAWALIIGGLIMEACDRFSASRRSVEGAVIRDGWLIGFAQALALIPGMSRSGSTISMARLLGFERSDAARISFLLSIPAVVLSGLFQLQEVVGTDFEWVPLIVATVVAFISGYASIAFLLRYLATHRVSVFTADRVALGVALLVWASGS
jgi:undecaprenyl-diphosphatase